jgi:hypothetical protein
MAGIQGSVGIGKEVTYGTAVASSKFFTATESISEERGRLREQMTFGTRSNLAADAGRLRIAGGISDIHARPGNIGDLLRAAFGAPVTVAAAPNYTHTFKSSVNKFSAPAALPPYSATIKREGLVHRYSGGQLNRLVLRQAKDDALMIDTDWIFKDVASVSAETISLENTSRFLFRHLTATKGGSALTDLLEDLTITIDNALDPEEALDGTSVISGVDFGDKMNITFDMTLIFKDGASYADFRDNVSAAYIFNWVINANTGLKLTVPKLNLDGWGAPISGPGRMTISASGTAEFDSVSGYELETELKNQVVSY